MSEDATQADAASDATEDAASLGNAAGALGEAFGQAMRVAIRRGRSEVERAATTGRHRLQLAGTTATANKPVASDSLGGHVS